MDLASVSKSLDSIVDAAKAQKLPGIDVDEISQWRGTLIELNQFLAKGSEYNFSTTISQSYRNLLEVLPTIEGSYSELSEEEKLIYGRKIQDGYDSYVSKMSQLKFNLSFYEKFGYFNNNVVAVGANGSGKTSLADNLRESLNANGLVISAQRVLFIPEIDNIPTPEKSQERWLTMNKKSRTYKNIDDFLQLKEEFGFVLENLIAKHCSFAIDLLDSSQSQARKSSELEVTLEIWNSIFEHRRIQLVKGIKLKVFVNDDSYEPIKLSEGEKSALYLISQVVQAPEKGFLIIDEPEMYLHKTIISKIWDLLERYRSDCTFIYLTHDLDFAVSRNTASKVWLKTFSYPNNWDIKNIPKNEIPEKLMLELLGSRNNILFCEGTKGSIDQNTYEILLPNFTVMPVEGCLNVINFTKAYNKLPNLNTTAFGIIDSDYHTKDRLDKLELEGIFSIKLAEVENLFLNEELLELVAERLFSPKVQQIKNDIINELEKDRELQATRFVTTKINNIFNNSHLEKANNADEIVSNLANFNSKLEITNWYVERLNVIDQIVQTKDYGGTISIFNNKGLKAIVEKHFGKQNYTEFALKFIAENIEALRITRQLIPEKLMNMN